VLFEDYQLLSVCSKICPRFTPHSLETLAFSSLFNRIQKRPYGIILGSMIVNLNLTSSPLHARIVFIRNKKNEWLAILLTDLSLSKTRSLPSMERVGMDIFF
jgi:hypothetical protein